MLYALQRGTHIELRGKNLCLLCKLLLQFSNSRASHTVPCILVSTARTGNQSIQAVFWPNDSIITSDQAEQELGGKDTMCKVMFKI